MSKYISLFQEEVLLFEALQKVESVRLELTTMKAKLGASIQNLIFRDGNFEGANISGSLEAAIQHMNVTFTRLWNYQSHGFSGLTLHSGLVIKKKLISCVRCPTPVVIPKITPE